MLKVLMMALVLTITSCASKDKDEAGSKVEAVKKEVKEVSKKAVKKAQEKMNTASVSETMETIVCTYNNDSRKISSVKLDNGGCEVHYDKFGERKVVATAAFDLGYCSQMANKVSNNLEEAGFSCK
jgi:type IV pilus biogenesis protein CpaD/CtpE